MPVNPKYLFVGLILACTLSGCGVVQVAESPESWGAAGGSYGAEEWTKTEPNGVYPSSDSVATYCVSIAESGQKKFNWTIQQVFESTDACSKAFVEGLS
jgi:uncharacterized protein YceK